MLQDVDGKDIKQQRYIYEVLGAAPGGPAGLAPPGPPAWGLGPPNPNLGGGVLSFLASRDLFLTTWNHGIMSHSTSKRVILSSLTLEWMAQLTQ